MKKPELNKEKSSQSPSLSDPIGYIIAFIMWCGFCFLSMVFSNR